MGDFHDNLRRMNIFGAPELMTADDAAERLGVPTSWLMAQAREGKCPHVRLGKYVRFSQANLEQLIAAGATGTLATHNKRPRATGIAGGMAQEV